MFGRGDFSFFFFFFHRLLSFEFGAHLKQRGFLVQDAHEQPVDVVLQVTNHQLGLTDLRLSLLQQHPPMFELGPLSLQVPLPLKQQ